MMPVTGVLWKFHKGQGETMSRRLSLYLCPCYLEHWASRRKINDWSLWRKLPHLSPVFLSNDFSPSQKKKKKKKWSRESTKSQKNRTEASQRRVYSHASMPSKIVLYTYRRTSNISMLIGDLEYETQCRNSLCRVWMGENWKHPKEAMNRREPVNECADITPIPHPVCLRPWRWSL